VGTFQFYIKTKRDKNMARPGGNPELKKYQFSSEGEPNNAQLHIWITKSLLTRLNNKFGANRNKWIRETLIKTLDEIDKNPDKEDSYPDNNPN
jgi:hypothetical protein